MLSFHWYGLVYSIVQKPGVVEQKPIALHSVYEVSPPHISRFSLSPAPKFLLQEFNTFLKSSSFFMSARSGISFNLVLFPLPQFSKLSIFQVFAFKIWSLLSLSVTVSECLFKPASTSVTLPFIVIPWKRLASKLPLMLAQTVIL